MARRQGTCPAGWSATPRAWGASSGTPQRADVELPIDERLITPFYGR